LARRATLPNLTAPKIIKTNQETMKNKFVVHKFLSKLESLTAK